MQQSPRDKGLKRDDAKREAPQRALELEQLRRRSRERLWWGSAQVAMRARGAGAEGQSNRGR